MDFYTGRHSSHTTPSANYQNMASWNIHTLLFWKWITFLLLLFCFCPPSWHNMYSFHFTQSFERSRLGRCLLRPDRDNRVWPEDCWAAGEESCLQRRLKSGLWTVFLWFWVGGWTGCRRGGGRPAGCLWHWLNLRRNWSSTGDPVWMGDSLWIAFF